MFLAARCIGSTCALIVAFAPSGCFRTNLAGPRITPTVTSTKTTCQSVLAESKTPNISLQKDHDMTDVATKTRAVLLDIEGTATPISFVHDVLFPFARDHVRDYLLQHSKRQQCRKIQPRSSGARCSTRSEVNSRREIDKVFSSIDAIVVYVDWLIGRDRKISST